MSSPILSLPESLAWKQAYMAAIRETNRARMSELIADARQKLASRLREITIGSVGPLPFYEHEEEIEAIHEAQYLLAALGSSLEHCARAHPSTDGNSEAA